MVKFHVVDEAVIQATPEEIEAAFADELLGRSWWWAPKLLMRTRGGRGPTDVGAITDIRVNSKGRADRPGAVRFTSRVTESEPGQMVTEYIDGAFRGRAVLTTEPVAEDRTRIRFDWQTQTHGLVMGIMARLMDIGASHSLAMQHGFAGLERYICERRASQPTRSAS